MPSKNTIDARHMVVVKHNDIVRVFRYKHTVSEQKLLMYLISKIKPGDAPDTTYRFDASVLCDVCGIKPTRQALRNLMLELKNLADDSFYVAHDTHRVKLHRWLCDVTLIFDKPFTTDATTFTAVADVAFDPFLYPYLMDLRENYTSYELENILAMQSKYSIRLYEYLKSYSYVGVKDVSLDELRDILQVEGYPVYNNFKVRVLDVAVQEINDYTDLYITYEPGRENRKISRIHFNIDQKSEAARIAAFANRHEVLTHD